MEGGTIPQFAGGQIGGISSEFSQTGCICPSTQRQTQAASASLDDMINTNNAGAVSSKVLIKNSKRILPVRSPRPGNTRRLILSLEYRNDGVLLAC